MREHLKVTLQDKNSNSISLELYSDEPFTVKDDELQRELRYLAWKVFENPNEEYAFSTTSNNAQVKL